MREGILCWYPYDYDASVLDLSGGTLTGMLENYCSSIKTNETAKSERFDYIVAMDPEDFSIDMLKSLYAKLGLHGRLLLAYENPFALRYWAGNRSRKASLPYDSLFGRGDIPSKAELSIRLKQVGFEGQKWYYPLTDHWFPVEIYSEAYLPNEFLNQRFTPYMADGDSLQFDERGLYHEVIRGGAFEFLCGAYLVEARVCGEDVPCTVDYVAVTAYREPSKRFATTVHNDGTVRKTPLHPDGRQSAANIMRNHQELAGLGINVVPVKLEGESLVMPRIQLPTLWDYWAKKLTDSIFDENEMIRHFDWNREVIYKAARSGKCYWELVPANCFYDEKHNEFIFFDQEYYWKDAPADAAMVRALGALKYSPVFRTEPRAEVWLERMKERYGLVERWTELSKLIDERTFAEVFGTGRQTLEQETERAVKRVASVRRYWQFLPVVEKLRELGFCRPAIYGCGIWGQTLLCVFQNSDIQVAAMVDQKFEQCKTIENIPSEIAIDVVIVSIRGGDAIAADLRSNTNIPVYALEELL